MKKLFVSLFFMIISIFTMYAQSSLTDEETEASEETPDVHTAVQAFRGIRIGMSLDQVKNIIKDDPFFNYGDSDIYILPAKEQKLLECTGNSYIKRAYFQFHENRLYIMIIELNKDKLDFYTLLTSLTKKYGEYTSFSPETVLWQVNGITLALERPATVKYIDTGVFNSLKKQSRLDKSSETQSLNQFLEEF